MTSSEPPPYPGDDSPGQDLPAYGSYDPPSGSTPPPPGGGFPPPVGSSTPFSPTEAIGWGWKKFRENLGPILLATIVLIGVSIVFNLIGRAVSGGDTFISYSTDGFGFSFAGLLAQIIGTFIGYVVSAAVIKGSIGVTQGRKFDLAESFSGLPIGNVIITSILIAIFEIIGFVLCIIPGLIVATLTAFALYFVVEKGQSPMEAISSSSRLVRDNLGDTIVLFLLSILVVILGLIACIVGVFVAIPVVVLAWAYAYKRFLGEPVVA